MEEKEEALANSPGGCCTVVQLIDRDGEFNDEGLQTFTSETKMADCGVSYAVVAVMGPQSGGKSTLLNHLFGTQFEEMDAYRGRSQTTKGIWIAKCSGMDTFTIAMDLEGTDSRERGQDDTAFERKSALFALATANIVLINMWCQDIGREHASNKPLLKTVFEVMMRLFTPRKTTLLFVIRDRTKTPLEHLEHTLSEDIQKVWVDVSKPEAYTNTPISEFFNVEFVALSSYEEKEEQFKEQVCQLRLQISKSISPGSVPGDGVGIVPASGFSYSLQQIWKTIRLNKNLDIPAHKVMVATVRCEEIAKEKFELFMSNEDWVSLEKAVQVGPVTGFGQKVSSILGFHRSKYDEESIYFDKGVREEKQQILESSLLDAVNHAYVTMLKHLSCQTLESFKTMLEQSLSNGEGLAAAVSAHKHSCMLQFDGGCEVLTAKISIPAMVHQKHSLSHSMEMKKKSDLMFKEIHAVRTNHSNLKNAAITQASWDTSEVRAKLCHEIETYVSSVKDNKLSEILDRCEKQLTDALGSAVESLFEVCEIDTWPEIRMHLRLKTGDSISKFSEAVNSLGLDQSMVEIKRQHFWECARKLVEKKAVEEIGKVLFRMKDRFTKIFNYDKDLKPRVWNRKEEIVAVTSASRSASLEILSVMAAMRLDGKPDSVEEELFSSFMDERSPKDKSTEPHNDPLVSNTWKEVSPNAILLLPKQCESLWKKFMKQTEHEVSRALSALEARQLIRRRESTLRTVAESAGAAAVGTATGVALVAVGVAVGPAGIVGGTVGLVAAAVAAANEMRNGRRQP